MRFTKRLIPALATLAFFTVTTLDASAVEGSKWNHARGRLIATMVQLNVIQARRLAFSRAFSGGELDFALDGNGMTLSALAFRSLLYQSLATVNLQNTLATTRFNVANARLTTLNATLLAYVVFLEAFLYEQFRPLARKTSPRLTFSSVDLLSVSGKGGYKPDAKFAHLTGDETITFRAKLSGGNSRGIKVRGTLRLSLANGDRLQ